MLLELPNLLMAALINVCQAFQLGGADEHEGSRHFRIVQASKNLGVTNTSALGVLARALSAGDADGVPVVGVPAGARRLDNSCWMPIDKPGVAHNDVVGHRVASAVGSQKYFLPAVPLYDTAAASRLSHPEPVCRCYPLLRVGGRRAAVCLLAAPPRPTAREGH
ncbi:hypothetical protein DAI22_03g194266 [Oryza sativa Japonica Group]|nr:hypothetical protein DAI22_03g194266 [Oryza sativa Japonica Group]